jgi:hypothetical protein
VHLTQRNHRAVDQFLRADGLCVVPGSSMTAIAQDLAAPMSRMPNICQLLCSSAVTPIERILVLCRDVDLKEHYIESAAKICHTLDTTPVILILAGSEYDAELKREYAEGVFHSRRMAADVDMVVDRDPIKAVERVASWRRCSHVIMPGNTECLEHVARDMSRSASVLTIPRSAVLEMPRKIGRAGIVPSTRVTFNQPVAASEHI